MSIPIVIPWLPATGNTAKIASVQNTTVAGQSLILNSTLPNLPKGPYSYDRVIREVSITRTNNPGAANVTITGIGSPVDMDGNPTQVMGNISEVLGTANNTTVNSANIYSQITSITTSDPVTGISAGFGSSGITDYVFLDYNRKFFQTSVQLQFINRVLETSMIYMSLNKPQTPNIVYGNLDNFQPIPAFQVLDDAADSNEIDEIPFPVSIVWANIQTSTAATIYFTVLQQGIT